MGIKFANFVDTTIADLAGVSAIATEFTVNAGDGALFPTLGVGDHCVIVCVTAAGAREIMHVTAVSTDTLTVVRARESTTGLVFAQDDIVQGRVTAGSLDLLDDLDDLTSTPAELEAAVDAVTAATDAATVSTLMKRDAAGRAKVVAPDAAADIALKSTVTADIATHDALATAHGTLADSLAADNAFTAGTIYWTKIGSLVTIHWKSLAHASAQSASTSSGFIPAAFRPTIVDFYGTPVVNNSGIYLIVIAHATGRFYLYHYNNDGSQRSTTGISSSSVSYIV